MTRKEVVDILSKGNSLVWADLRGADLSGVDLSGTDLQSADLSDADLSYANLQCANLFNTNLQDANLQHADLHGVDLRCASLQAANLQHANLQHANLQDTYLSKANLNDTDLTGAKGALIEYRKGKVLTEPLIGYKQCQDGVIVTLEIPKGATVFSINGDKCRTNKVKVVAIDGADRGISHYKHMSYYVGDVITINDFDWRYNIECTTGIHFFMSREEAENYIF